MCWAGEEAIADGAGACYGGIWRGVKVARSLAQRRRKASGYEAPIHREKDIRHVMGRFGGVVLMGLMKRGSCSCGIESRHAASNDGISAKSQLISQRFEWLQLLSSGVTALHTISSPASRLFFLLDSHSGVARRWVQIQLLLASLSRRLSY